jgi:5-(carboxyamino)imidazole ribonucleotide mutase
MSDATHPVVAIVMGSDSDLPVMQEAAKILGEFGIAHEVTIVSAHRTPGRMVRFAEAAAGRGIRVIIAGAGGAAHLPGMIASLTPLPVIGVPIQSRSLDGLDSLLSIVQMPPGIPVATMAINGARNAGLLAASIIGTGDAEVLAKVAAFKARLEDEITRKAEALESLGYQQYLETKARG